MLRIVMNHIRALKEVFLVTSASYSTPSVCQSHFCQSQNSSSRNSGKKIEQDEKILETLNKRWMKWNQISEQQEFSKIPRLHKATKKTQQSCTFLQMRHYQHTELQLTSDQSVIIISQSSLYQQLKERSLTIPKLELQEAVITVGMKKTVLHEISFHLKAIFL